MKIAMITNSFPSISEKFLINQISGLLKEGVELTVYAATRSSDTIIHSSFSANNMERCTRQINIPRRTGWRILHFPLLFILNFFRTPQKTLRALSVTRYKRAAKNLKTLYFLHAMKDEHYDVVHCQFGQNGYIGVFLKDCGIANRVVITFHGSDITVVPRKDGHDYYDRMFHNADLITAGTSFTKKLLIEHGCPENKIRILPAGVNAEEYESIDPSKHSDKILLSVGRLEEVKGFEYAIKAVGIARKSIPNLQYLIVGDGSLYTKLKQLIREKELEDTVFLLGQKQDVAIRELYQNASIMIAPSIRAQNGSEEGQGLVIQEAGISGIPVIGTMTGGIPDGVINGVTGFLVPEKDEKTIADKIITLMNDSALRSKMGNAAYRFVANKYTISTLSMQLVYYYANN